MHLLVVAVPSQVHSVPSLDHLKPRMIASPVSTCPHCHLDEQSRRVTQAPIRSVPPERSWTRTKCAAVCHAVKGARNSRERAMQRREKAIPANDHPCTSAGLHGLGSVAIEMLLRDSVQNENAAIHRAAANPFRHGQVLAAGTPPPSIRVAQTHGPIIRPLPMRSAIPNCCPGPHPVVEPRLSARQTSELKKHSSEKTLISFPGARDTL